MIQSPLNDYPRPHVGAVEKRLRQLQRVTKTAQGWPKSRGLAQQFD
jgi:hypothetical protein